MRAVILAAGRGGRLRGAAGNHPKCLARVGALTLLERQIDALRACGVDDIAVVAGHRAGDVRAVCSPRVDIVLNTRYAATNSLYSLWLARDLLAGGFVVLNADVLFHPRLLHNLITARDEDALLVEARETSRPYGDEEMKVRLRGGCIVAIDKSLPAGQADGENLGVGKFGAAGAALLVEIMNQIVGFGGVGDWLPRAFAAFCQRRPLHAIESRGLPWIEIDFPEDYWRACSEVLPAIDGAAHDAAATEVEQLGGTVRHV
jgi:choline kinase